jgi:hypothetical protein
VFFLEVQMTRLIDDIVHYFKRQDIDLSDDRTPDDTVAMHWPAIEQDASVQAHGKLRGSIAAALACELIHAEQENFELRRARNEAWRLARLLREAM